jgi:hypothetical protein
LTRTLRSLSFAAVLAATTLVGAVPAGAGDGSSDNGSRKPLTIAVVGDVPYGVAQEATVGTLVEAVNEDRSARSDIRSLRSRAAASSSSTS